MHVIHHNARFVLTELQQGRWHCQHISGHLHGWETRHIWLVMDTRRSTRQMGDQLAEKLFEHGDSPAVGGRLHLSLQYLVFHKFAEIIVKPFHWSKSSWS
jgi:hypothetical protein